MRRSKVYEFSNQSRAFQSRLQAFMDEHVYPNEALYARQLHESESRFAPVPLMDELKSRAREAGLWNLFVSPHHAEYCDHGGFSNVDYAPMAEMMGRVLWSPEIFNCNAPDTGNMEVLMNYGDAAQQERWLRPLLSGEIRSSYAMTEPQVASSDATNIELRIEREGDEWVLNGRKWFITNAMYERTKIFIVMGKSDPDNPNRHLQQSQVLVPKDTPGVTLVRPLTTLGYDDAPLGHAEVDFKDVRVPLENMLLGAGRGFEIAQGRLGPGRIHHCMRSIGLAEKALELACKRSLSREAFGKPLAKLGGNAERIADARIAIEQARLLVLKAAWTLDEKGIRGAMNEVSQIKVAVPRMALEVIDMAMQLHGGAGMCEDFPLAQAWAGARSLRIADGPDEVHKMLVARFEFGKYR